MNYKINQIKRLIESLNPYEIRELTDYLMEEVDVDLLRSLLGRDPLRSPENYINRTDIRILTNKMIKKEIPITKEILMLTNRDGWSVAHELAVHSDEANWKTNDKEILMLKDRDGISVAYLLAGNSHITKWETNDKEILMLRNRDGQSVAHRLAYFHPTWTTSDPEILSLTDTYGETVEDVLEEEGKI